VDSVMTAYSTRELQTFCGDPLVLQRQLIRLPPLGRGRREPCPPIL